MWNWLYYSSPLQNYLFLLISHFQLRAIKLHKRGFHFWYKGHALLQHPYLMTNTSKDVKITVNTSHYTFPRDIQPSQKAVHPIYLITPSLRGVIISTSAVCWAPTSTRISTQRAPGPTTIRSPQIFPHVATTASFISPCATVVSIQEWFWILTVINQCWCTKCTMSHRTVRAIRYCNSGESSSTSSLSHRKKWGRKKKVRSFHQHQHS